MTVPRPLDELAHPVPVPHQWREQGGIVEVLREGVGQQLASARVAGAPVAAVLGDAQLQRGQGDGLQQQVGEGVEAWPWRW
jgi:hypothetical protein